MTYTVDASVFVASALPTDVHHTDSLRFLTELRSREDPVCCPALAVVEAAAAVARQTGSIPLARGAARIVTQFPRMRLLNLARTRSRRAAGLAAALRLRGADAVYVAAAVEARATLVTWDSEMMARSAGTVTVQTPTDWLASPRT